MTETVKLRTTGMHCQSCSMLIEMNVGDLEGVENVSSDFHTGVTEVTYDPSKISEKDVEAEIEKSGYGVEGVVS